MIFQPKPYQLVRIHYRESAQATMPYHGHIGIIDKVAPGQKAKNCLVLVGRHVDQDHLDGRLVKVVIPRGNLVHIGRCLHENTRYLKEPWPDGGTIELCNDCGMSRHHWEQGESDWIMVEDLDEAREEVQASIDKMFFTSEG